MQITKLSKQDILPLTCSRSGACCHGNMVWLNPWELFCLAKEKNISPAAFRDLYCDYGGIQLRFNGKTAWGNKKACSQYIENEGCSVHSGRPLACRLYPLGRQIQSKEVHYMFQGKTFPCLQGCPEVLALPQLTVGEYLKGQATASYEKAQDAYLELMQNIADMSFELLLDSGLSESGDKKTVPLWRKMGKESPEALAKRIGPEWMDALMIPVIDGDWPDPISFIQKHTDLLQTKVQEKFGGLQTMAEYHEASVLLMGVALHLARSVGANPEVLAKDWSDMAKSHGAKE
jgi:uncharacterized protein